MAVKRREFLGHMAAGSAIVTMPAFLQGCGVQSATAVSQATPENPFMAWFGVDQATAARVMSELTATRCDLRTALSVVPVQAFSRVLACVS
jgi:hypothetical protein